MDMAAAIKCQRKDTMTDCSSAREVTLQSAYLHIRMYKVNHIQVCGVVRLSSAVIPGALDTYDMQAGYRQHT